MKKITTALSILGLACSFAHADCSELMKKYEAPDPASKTMSQIERWVKRKVTDSNDANVLQECMIAGAADNPNKVQVAGK